MPLSEIQRKERGMTIKLTREEAIQDLEAIKSFERYARGRLALDMAIEALKDRPKGEWIHSPNGIDRDFIWWVCSECGHKIFSETEKDRIEFHAYCGRCGADMRPTERSEE